MDLLDSQFADLEEPGPEERPIIADVADPAAFLGARIMTALGLKE